MNGKDVLMEVSRGSWVEDVSGWKTCSADPLDGEDPYRAWEIKASFDGGEYTATVALPEGDSSYFKDVFGIWTEFLATPGPVRVYYWDIAYQREGDPTWVAIPNWKVAYRDGTAANPTGFGFRIGAYQGHRVIEVSNDPALHYADAGTTLSLDGPAYEPTAPITWRVLSDGDSGRVYELSNQRRPLPLVR
jgi:hypothetical protein